MFKVVIKHRVLLCLCFMWIHLWVVISYSSTIYIFESPVLWQHNIYLTAKVAVIYFEEYFWLLCFSAKQSCYFHLNIGCESFLWWSVWQHMWAGSKTTHLCCTVCVVMDLNVSLSFNQVKQRPLVILRSQSSSPPPALSHNTAGQHSTAQETDTSSASIFRCLTCVNKSSPRRKHNSSQEEADGSERRPNSDGLS